MIKRGSTEAKILGLVQHRPEMPIEEVARKLGLKSSTVRRCIHKLKNSGLIHTIALIDYGALGFDEYTILLSLKPCAKQIRQKFCDRCLEEEKVSRLEELGGEFEYAVSFLAQNPQQVSQFLESFGEKIGNVISHKTISILESYTGMGRKYLAGSKVLPLVRIPHQERKKVSIDELDHQVLRQLVADADRSHHAMARALSVSTSTFSYRVQKLRDAGVLQAFIYGVRARLLGCVRLRFLINVSSVTTAFRKKFEAFMLDRLEVVNMSRLIGGVDFILHVEVFDAHDALMLSQDIAEEFCESVNKISILPFFGFKKKNTTYPFV